MAGHRVFTPTLTGLGDRSHLCSPAVVLTTHVLDVANLALWEDLDGFVLCGHSYGGAVITGVAARIGAHIASIVYVDAFIPADGEAMTDIAPRRPVPGGTTPPPAGNLFRVNERDRAWVEAKSTPQPNGTFTEKLTVTGAYQRVAKRAYIRATHYDAPHFRRYYDACRATRGWQTYEVAAGHMVMLDAPDALARILLQSL